MTFALTSAATKLVVAGAAIAVLAGAWLLDDKAAHDLAVSIVAALVALALLLKVVVSRFKVGSATWLSLAAFASMNFLMNWDISLARDRAASLMEVMKNASHGCKETDCVLAKAGVQADSNYTNAILVPVKGFGANIYVRFSAHRGKCFLWTDHLLGGEKGVSWSCELNDT